MECKQSKGAKFCAGIKRELEREKAIAKHSINSEDIFKLTKNVLEKRSTKEESSNTTTSKILSKICNRKNLHSNSTTFPCLKVL